MMDFLTWPWLLAVFGGAVLLAIGIGYGIWSAGHATRAQDRAAEEGARRMYHKDDDSGPHAAAYRHGESAANDGAAYDVRNAGPGAMQDPPENWDETDETSDESFPASDPPAKY